MTAPGCRCTTDCTCGACRGFRDSTPLLVENRPGVAAVRYRVGDHGRFTAGQSMLMTGRATDAEDGALSGSRLRWTVTLVDGDQEQTVALADLATGWMRKPAPRPAPGRWRPARDRA